MNREKKGIEKKNTLWTKNYSCITIATILSVIGGEAMNLPISLLVFEETQSTMLSAIIMVCGMLPDILLSVIVAPFIDKGKKKRWVVGLDILMVSVYFIMGIWVRYHEFQYGLYLAMTLVLGTISVFYRLAYGAWYPSLIPVGFEQKGYAVSGTIYPFVTIVMSPVATLLYEATSMSNLFLLAGGIGVVSILIEALIDEDVKTKMHSYTFSDYKQDIKEGFAYLKKEKGIRNIYTYMAVMQGTSEGTAIAMQAFFQTQSYLTVTMLGILKSAEMIGRFISGTLQYRFEIPVKKRYLFTKFVYIFYQLADMILLFSPYAVMVVNRFLCGGLGTASATIRSVAVQSYLPDDIRARVNALFNAVCSVGCVVFQVFAGALGEVLPYRVTIIIMGMISLAAMWLLIVKPAQENRPVYEAVRK